MTTLDRPITIAARLGVLLLAIAAAETPAPAGHHRRVQVITAQAPVVYTAQAPVAYTAQAPVAYTAQAPVAYTAQAPVAYTAQAPVAYTAQAPVTYTAQAPVAYTAQAPAVYTSQTYASAPAGYVMTTGSAPVAAAPTTTSSFVGSAPTTAFAPTAGIRISNAIRNAIEADLIAFYHGAESGETRIEKIQAVREQATDTYTSFLENEEDPELNAQERADLNAMVDRVVAGAPADGGRVYYPPSTGLGPAAYGSGYSPAGFGPTPVFVQSAPSVQPVGLILVPRPRSHPIHRLFKDW